MTSVSVGLCHNAYMAVFTPHVLQCFYLPWSYNNGRSDNGACIMATHVLPTHVLLQVLHNVNLALLLLLERPVTSLALVAPLGLVLAVLATLLGLVLAQHGVLRLDDADILVLLHLLRIIGLGLRLGLLGLLRLLRLLEPR